MKTIIILGLTYNQIPLIEKVKELGYRAIAIGVGGTKPVAAKHADAWFSIDTSDKEAVLELAVKEKAAGLITCGTSTAMCSIAYVTEKLKLSNKVISYDVSLNAVYKDRFRKIIPTLLPKGFFSSTLEDAIKKSETLTFPVILKPADGGGGKGVTIIENNNEAGFADAFNHAYDFSYNQSVIVEEFVEGQVFGTESIIINGKIYLLVIADKIISDPPHCVTLGIAFPSKLSKNIIDKIKKVNSQAINKLGIKWGMTHIDMAINRHDEPKIFDIGPRMAGGLIASKLIPETYSYDFYKAAIQLSTGETPDEPKQSNELYYGSRFIISSKTGILKSISYNSENVNKFKIENIRQLVFCGAEISNVKDDSSRLMIFSSKADSYEKLVSNLNCFTNEITIEIE